MLEKDYDDEDLSYISPDLFTDNAMALYYTKQQKHWYLTITDPRKFLSR